MVSLRNFTITNFFRAIRFFLYVSLMPWMKAAADPSHWKAGKLRQVRETTFAPAKETPGPHPLLVYVSQKDAVFPVVLLLQRIMPILCLYQAGKE